MGAPASFRSLAGTVKVSRCHLRFPRYLIDKERFPFRCSLQELEQLTPHAVVHLGIVESTSAELVDRAFNGGFRYLLNCGHAVPLGCARLAKLMTPG
jgi:hypothetical protein